MNVTRLFGLAAAMFVALPAARGLACSPACPQTAVFPGFGELPANLVQLLFTPSPIGQAPDGGGVSPRLFRVEGEAKISLPLNISAQPGGSSWLISPVEPQPVGAQLLLEADTSSPCDREPFARKFTVGDAHPLPTELGTLQVELARELLAVPMSQPDCWPIPVGVDASYAKLTLQLSDVAKPFERFWSHTLIVDGAPHARFGSGLIGGSQLPPGQDLLYTVCEDSGASVRHRVRMQSTLVDGTTLSTPELEVELRCDGTPPQWPDGSVPHARSDGSTTIADAGVPPARSDGSTKTADAGMESPASNADGCALAERTDGAWLLALALLLQRRRARASHSPSRRACPIDRCR
ncbi:MAG TPA: hypothetical protein VI299_14385 [Polyangiales bacterium]